MECRTHLPIPGRKTKINIGKDIFCEIVKKGVTDKLEEQERWRFEEQKAKDIVRLENQLKNLETRIADAEIQTAAKKGQIQAANEALGNLGMGERRVRDQYNARGCRHGAQDWGA
ncbi:MAG: hypothetical protein K8S25_02065 [Alphaproteobacteria bacterium]|nr:hypothetical protein [Alphaproteobacteria bacterium]